MPKSCPNPTCQLKYDRRNPPDICPECRVLVGKVNPSEVGEKIVRKKLTKEINPKHATVDLGDGLYSVQYHQHNR